MNSPMAKQTLSYRYYYLSPPNPAWKENYSWQLTNRNAKPGAGFEEPARGGSFGPVLVKWADVLVTNFLPRVRQRLRLNYEDVASLNPRLIYADITRYGELGAESGQARLRPYGVLGAFGPHAIHARRFESPGLAGVRHRRPCNFDFTFLLVS